VPVRFRMPTLQLDSTISLSYIIFQAVAVNFRKRHLYDTVSCQSWSSINIAKVTNSVYQTFFPLT
jgi:uncharacterized membrane protein YcfT